MPNYRALQISGVTFTGPPPAAADQSPPTAPTGVSATRYGLGVQVLWTAATDNIGVVAYDIYRSASSGFTTDYASFQATVFPPTVAWTDPNPVNTVMYYKVVARDAAGNGTVSAQATLAALSNTQLLVNGSLVLFDPSDPVNPWVALGAAPPNLAATFADATIGGSSALVYANTMVSPGGTVERSTKGGLHFIVSQTAGISAQLASVQRSSVMATYLLANPTHDMYLGVSFKNTRLCGTPGQSTYYPYKVSKASTVSGDGYIAIGTQTSTGASIAVPTTSDPHRIAVDLTTGPDGQVHATIATTDAQAGFTTTMHTGLIIGGAPSAGFVNQVQSHLVWRYYLEDLTVSGRSYSQVYAIDHALHIKEVLTTGGRYYGDTYSNPASAMP
jgi:hypothetical protein